MNAAAAHIEARILAIIHERGSILLEQLPSCLPNSTWNQVFMSVDGLSRQGAIRLVRRRFDYEICSPSPTTAGPFKSAITPSAARCALFQDSV